MKKINSSTKFTILAIVLIAIFCIALTPITFQNDTYYTIKVGEHIAQYGIDNQDPFSWHEDLSYTYPHWAYDLITYYIYNAFGFAGIYVTTCILSAILGISVFLINKKLAKNQIFSFLITIGVMYIIRSYIAARAQLLTFILFIWTIFLIEKFIETKKKRYGIGLIIIPIIVANVHSAVFPFYFVLYLPYIAEYLISLFSEIIIYRKIKIFSLKLKIKKYEKIPEKAEELKKLKEEQRKLEEQLDRVKIKRTKDLQNPYKIKITKNKNVKWLILIMIICLFTGLLTPLGNTPYTYLIKTMQGNTTQNINEHLPMTIAGDTDAMCTLIIFLWLLIFTKSKIRLSDLFMVGGLCYLMLKTKRQVTMFAIICSIPLNRLVIQIIENYVEKEKERLLDKICNVIGILVISIMMFSLSYYFAKDKINDKFVDEKAYPVQAADFILQYIDLGTAKFYNEYNYGSYLIFRGIPVFIDSRADLYAPEFSGKEEDIFSDFIDTSSMGKFYGDIFEKYGITHVIAYENSKVNMVITKIKDPNYVQLYKDDHFVIYRITNH